MRTLIQGGWVVGYTSGQHQILKDGVCVIEDDRILHVGKSFDGQVDATIDAVGKLVSPGLISTHLHAGLKAGEYVFLDVGRPESMARNYLNWEAGLRGKPRYKPDQRASVLFGLGQCLRAGATTVVEIGAGGDPQRFVELVDELGIRVYTGLSYRNEVVSSGQDGRFEHEWDDERGEKGLRAALEVAERLDGSAGGLLRSILCPSSPESCSEQVLKETAHQARQHSLPVTIHAAIHPMEMERTLEMSRETPIQLLARVGLLGTNVILGQALFVSSHSWSRYREAPDLKLLGQHQASVSHSPLKYIHEGVYLESMRRYLEAGVNLTIGTDFSPGDILVEMRSAMLMSRIADRSFLSGTPREVFNAATLNAARALGRDDLGRLAQGAKADLVVFDLHRMHIGPVHDPIKSLVETGHGSDVDLVMVDGKVVVKDSQLVSVDQSELLSKVQGEAEKIWADVPNWMWGGRDIEQIAPPAFPII